jgi:hypothetical protein
VRLTMDAVAADPALAPKDHYALGTMGVRSTCGRVSTFALAASLRAVWDAS